MRTTTALALGWLAAALVGTSAPAASAVELRPADFATASSATSSAALPLSAAGESSSAEVCIPQPDGHVDVLSARAMTSLRDPSNLTDEAVQAREADFARTLEAKVPAVAYEPQVMGRFTSNIDGKTILNATGSLTTASAVPWKGATVKVYWHVITNGTAASKTSTTRINRQIAVLNAAYQPAGFRFVLAKVDYTYNKAWYTASSGSTAERQMKNALYRGNESSLNVYSAGIGRSMLGWATLPNARMGKSDGLVILNSTLPGGTRTNYNQGDTAVHEIGHWLGLYHTFQGGCGNADQVRDTPAEANPTYGCPTGTRNTCTAPGSDSVRNYMNYSYDSCMNSFTKDQITRMRLHWVAYRMP